MEGLRGKKERLVLTIGVLLMWGLAMPAGAGGKPETGRPPAEPAERAEPRPTVEPMPPVSLEIRVERLQKHAKGGVVSVTLESKSDVDLDDLTLSIRLPSKVRFSDGTSSRTWQGPLAAGGKIDLPADLLVDDDGKFVVSAEASAIYQGRPIHRGLAFNLLVGVQETRPPTKDGAIEYQGVPDGGGE